ncbi:MAG TPA: hypothetical protein VGZ52_07475, partial [Acidimicrobiales bacterium]|nr:hypothetical protein [Acidimicrobiales bacterium]
MTTFELGLFDEVGEAVRGLMLPKLGVVRFRAHRYGVKLWFDDETAPREHYEAQVVGPKHVPDAKVLALEVGFHAEHPKVADNDATLARLTQKERTWRKVVGTDAVAGGFLGRADQWRRVSETWADPDLGDDDLVMEIALRLTDYMTALEPV